MLVRVRVRVRVRVVVWPPSPVKEGIEGGGCTSLSTMLLLGKRIRGTYSYINKSNKT